MRRSVQFTFENFLPGEQEILNALNAPMKRFEIEEDTFPHIRLIEDSDVFVEISIDREGKRVRVITYDKHVNFVEQKVVDFLISCGGTRVISQTNN